MGGVGGKVRVRVRDQGQGYKVRVAVIREGPKGQDQGQGLPHHHTTKTNILISYYPYDHIPPKSRLMSTSLNVQVIKSDKEKNEKEGQEKEKQMKKKEIKGEKNRKKKGKKREKVDQRNRTNKGCLFGSKHNFSV